MQSLHGMALAFPILLAEHGPGGAFVIEGEIVGTAFALDREWLLTAGHVAKELVAADPRFGVAGFQKPDGTDVKAAVITECELLSGDVAILKIEHVFKDSAEWLTIPKWERTPLNPFEPVRTLGFPYGINRVDDKRTMVQRAFQGHVVARLLEFKPIGWPEAAFPAYELSFATPRGLSGAPLTNCVGTVNVNGVIIGNTESKMLVFRTEERFQDQEGSNIVEHYDTSRLGVAVAADFVVALTSDLLGSSVGDFLSSRGRLT